MQLLPQEDRHGKSLVKGAKERLNLYRAFVEGQEVFEGTWSAKFIREEGDRTTVMVYTSP